MLLTVGEFLTGGETNLVGLDPFKQVMELYRIESDLTLTWLESHDVNQQVRYGASWSAMVSGHFGSNSQLKDLCFYDTKQNELVFIGTKPFGELDSSIFDRSDFSQPVRYDQLCAGNFFSGSESGLALLTSSSGSESIWFRSNSNADEDQVWKVPKEWSWMASGDFMSIGTDQVLLHRR